VVGSVVQSRVVFGETDSTDTLARPDDRVDHTPMVHLT